MEVYKLQSDSSGKMSRSGKAEEPRLFTFHPIPVCLFSLFWHPFLSWKTIERLFLNAASLV